MSLRPYRDIYRRTIRQIHVGRVPVGGDAPITVQTMTNTIPSDVPATIAQINEVVEAGADIVRVSCPDEASSAALREIDAEIDQISVERGRLDEVFRQITKTPSSHA